MKITFPSGREIEVQHGIARKEDRRDGYMPLRFMRLAWSYTIAVAAWKAAGSPLRTQDEIDAALALCSKCPYFRGSKKPFCTICGCQLNKLRNGLANKIAMATEHCPMSPPKW